MILACQPKDNKLASPNRNSSGPGSQSVPGAKSLNVGSYGLSILSVQNVEKMGSLVRLCLEKLQNKEILAQPVGDFLHAECSVQQQFNFIQGSLTQISNQNWTLELVLSGNTAEFDMQNIISVSGRNSSGFHLSKFKDNVLKTTSNVDQFQIQRNFENFTYSSKQIFEVQSSGLSYFMTHDSTGLLQIQDQIWNLQLESNYNYLNLSKMFQVKIERMQLSWESPQCANFEGLTNVLDGQLLFEIQINPTQASLLNNPRPWQQSLMDCTTRTFSFHNFEFLFY